MSQTNKRTFTLLMLVSFGWLLPQTALAEGEPNVEAMGEIARLVRWSGVFTSLLVIMGAFIGVRFMRETVETMGKRFPSRRLLLQKIATVAQFSIYVATGVSVLALSFRVNQSVLALVGGTVAVSVGFAIKDLVASFIAGIMIMVDRPFQVGDRVSFGGEYGDVTAIGLRSVRLQTLDDNTVTIPNNKFLNDMTSNGNYGALDMQVVLDFHIGANQDARLGRDLLSECAVASRYVYLDKPVVVLVEQVVLDNYVAVRLRLKCYVLDTRFEKALGTDITLRAMDAFRAAGVDAPALLIRPLREVPG